MGEAKELFLLHGNGVLPYIYFSTQEVAEEAAAKYGCDYQKVSMNVFETVESFELFREQQVLINAKSKLSDAELAALIKHYVIPVAAGASQVNVSDIGDPALTETLLEQQERELLRKQSSS